MMTYIVIYENAQCKAGDRYLKSNFSKPMIFTLFIDFFNAKYGRETEDLHNGEWYSSPKVVPNTRGTSNSLPY